ncbi:OsmC family protein [Paeniglutamicibacter sp. MACA_103]|uniref:OsmC family protein n=1 Tax=Paeniglutamicibacter sp. MACA_103 TaxID=3377337 RepID=UPI0038950BED
MLNNVDIKALAGAKGAITATPSAGIASYGVRLDWISGVRAEVTALPMNVGGEEIQRDFTWVVDEPPQLLGQSQGPTPQEYLMSGVGACIMVGFMVNATMRNIEVRSLNVTMKGSLDLAGFMNLRDDAKVEMDGLVYEIEVDADASEQDLDEIRQAAVEFSPNAMTIAHQVSVTGTVKQLQKQ